MLEHWPIARFVPYAGNPRRNDHAVDKTAAAIGEFGFRVPILAKSDGTVIDGHLRLKAAQKLGLATLPVLLADDMTDAQVKAFRISVNKVADLADWDFDLLAGELAGLHDFDLDLIGFDPAELADIEARGRRFHADPDDVPEAPAVPVSALGDVWLMGKHRLVCGDCTNPGVVKMALGDAKPHLMITDPPYGVDYDPDWRNRADRANGKPDGARAVGLVTNDGRADWREAWALFPGDVAYVWHDGRNASLIQQSLEAAKFELRCQIIWAKQQFAIGRGDYHWQHEPCWYAVRKGATGHWSGDRKQTTLWQIDKPVKSETGHSTQKPVECMARPMRNNSKTGQSVYDPFMGSGTSIIAAEELGRVSLGIEISPTYVDVSVLRWQTFTGLAATLEASGATFDATRSERENG